MASIHWYPGHMAAATKKIREHLKVVDIIVELVDARAPISSRHPFLADYEGKKARLLILAKSDLADPYATSRWIQYFEERHYAVLALNLMDMHSGKALVQSLKTIGQPVWDRQASKGMKPQPLRAMIVGIPNVGKSTLINRLAKKSAVEVADRPGVTRAPQWIKPDDQIWLLDTPGILPMHYELKRTAINLALVGSIKRDVLPIGELAEFLFGFMTSNYTKLLRNYLGHQVPTLYPTFLDEVAQRFGLVAHGALDRDQAASRFYQDFKDGIIGRATLEVAY